MVAASDLAWDISLSDQHVWQREALVLTVRVKTPDSFARLRVDTLTIEGADVVALPFIRTEISPTNTNQQLSLRWRITPHYAGKKTIQLPLIRYFVNGAKKAQWQAPIQILQVDALPPYFPPTLPIGMVNIESYIEPKGLLQPDHLAYWHVSLSSKTLTPEQFPSLLKQIQSNANIEILPAKLSTKTQFEPAQFEQHYIIPLKAKHNGRLDLPKLQWHWFNPETGRLQKHDYQASRPLVLARIWQIILGLILTGLTLLLAHRLIRTGYQVYQQRLSKWRLYRILQQPKLHDFKHIQAIRNAMQSCATVHHWPRNLSNQQWLHYWDKTYGKDQKLHNAIREFEKIVFSLS
jgi:hypothetical protein